MATKTNNQGKKSKTKVSDLIFLAAISYLCLLIEAPINSFFRGFLFEKLPIGSLALTLIFYAVCALIWFLLGKFIMKLSRSNCSFRIMNSGNKLTSSQWALTIISTIAAIALFLILDGNGFKIIIDSFSSLKNVLHTLGYYVYCAARVFIIVIFIALTQKFGDMVFKVKWVPYGGLLLGVLWTISGLLNIGFSPMAFTTLGYGLIYGIVFLLAGKNSLVAYPFLTLIFIFM